MKPTPTIDAEAGGTCSACGRTHRRLVLVDGFWLGKTCQDDYEVFKRFGESELMWAGYPKQLAKIKTMVGK